MDELSPEIHAEVERLSAFGNAAISADDSWKAVRCFRQALDVLPDPPENWEAAMWLFAAIGDCFYRDGEWNEAIEALSDALKCPDGLGNPFIHLRLGQCYYEVKDEKKALDELIRAYMSDGEGVFDGEPPQYFEFLKARVTL